MISFECNNPFNIRYDANNNWKGQIGEIRGFVAFKNLEYGLRAGLILVKNYIIRGCTLKQFINRYAPSSENNTQAYLDYLCASLVMSPDTELMTKDIFCLSKFLISYECNLGVSIKSLKEIAWKYEII